ncbi:hypothetical protein GCM10025762_54800 [Haloechinothrix salitolerans]
MHVASACNEYNDLASRPVPVALRHPTRAIYAAGADRPAPPNDRETDRFRITNGHHSR